jgi:hypothetical protein
MSEPARLVVSYARRMRVREAYERSTRRGPNDARSSLRPSGLSGVGAYRRWSTHADTVGFPVGGMTSVLVLGTDDLEVHTTTFVRSRPKVRVGSVPLDRIREFRTAGGVLHTKLVMLLDDGGIVEFETALRSRARRFITAVLERRDAVR